MSNYLLALDQSTQVTGFALFQNNVLIKSGCISFPERDYLVRITKLRRWVSNIISALPHDRLKIAIEDIQFQPKEPNGGRYDANFGLMTYKKLAHTQGALLSLLVEEGIDYEIIPSSSWKKTCKVTGSRKDEQKKNAKIFAMKQYNIDLNSKQDEADAICIGYHVLATQKKPDHDWTI